MVFGVFDGLHDGHRAMLKEAKSYGDFLVVVVSQDHIVQHLKGYRPKLNLPERMAHLRAEDYVDEIVIGDKELGTWEIVKRRRPDIIVCGYDQQSLKENLEEHFDKIGYEPRIVVLSSYEPNTPKT